jgi:3',5'-cyclic AMP phosphodiesterase CpdA
MEGSTLQGLCKSSGAVIDEMESMRTVVHLSDIHFGKVDHNLIEPLIRAVHEARPSVVVVSGDLTQRGRRQEYQAARDFLMSLPGPQIVVPGNHDVPIYSPIERFTRPLGRFKRYITPNLHPFFEDEELAVIGINTSRALRTKYGHISKTQVEVIRDRLCPIPHDRVKIVVTHHPFDLPKGYNNTKQLVNRAGRAMKVLAECGADLFLSGHLHRVFTSETAERYKIDNYSALIVQAGTAFGSRLSQEGNSFNIIECEEMRISVTRYDWDGSSFVRKSIEEFKHTEETGWKRATQSSNGVSAQLHDEDAGQREHSPAEKFTR